MDAFNNVDLMFCRTGGLQKALLLLDAIAASKREWLEKEARIVIADRDEIAKAADVAMRSLMDR